MLQAQGFTVANLWSDIIGSMKKTGALKNSSIWFLLAYFDIIRYISDKIICKKQKQ
jgi:hypothetical protein